MSITKAQNHRDFRGLKMADTCQDPSIQERLSLIMPFVLIKFASCLKQGEKMKATCPSSATSGQRSGILTQA